MVPFTVLLSSYAQHAALMWHTALEVIDSAEITYRHVLRSGILRSDKSTPNGSLRHE